MLENGRKPIKMRKRWESNAGERKKADKYAKEMGK
jgi:hypothetical protein